MSKKKQIGVIYSTNTDFQFQYENEDENTTSPMQQNFKISLDKKNRAGKQVTLVNGYIGNPNTLEELGKELKNKCGTGGSVKGKQIIIQGDFREKIQKILTERGHKAKIL